MSRLQIAAFALLFLVGLVCGAPQPADNETVAEVISLSQLRIHQAEELLKKRPAIEGSTVMKKEIAEMKALITALQAKPASPILEQVLELKELKHHQLVLNNLILRATNHS